MQITYDATGRKWEKIGEGNVKTEYISGIEYRDNNLEAIYAPDGRIVYDHVGDEYRTEYFRQDHLGNNRLTFCDFNNNGIIEISDDPGTPANELEITQETHYYPFGMEQNGNWYATVTPDNNYLYNGKELNRDFDINLYEYGARWYDPAIGRFIGVDPIADQFPWVNTYNYAENRPINAIDLHGLQAVDIHCDIKIAEKLAQRDGSDIVENFKAIRGHESSLSIPSGSTSGALAKGKIADANAFGSFSLEGSFMNGEAYNNSELSALSIGAEASLFSAEGDFQFGPDLLGIIFGAEGSALSATSNLDFGVFLGQGDKVGPLFDGNIGAFSAEGEIYGGTTILGVKFTGTLGGSVGSAHAGLTVGMTYDKETTNITIEGMEHLGLGFGQKAGAKVEIPTFGLFQQDDNN